MVVNSLVPILPRWGGWPGNAWFMSTVREASVYDGPVIETEIRAGGRTIHLVRPGDPDRLLDDPEVAAWNQAVDYMPYWAYLWPGSFLLSAAVIAGDYPARTRTLELGCGLGLPGLVAVSAGLEVEFTDHDRTPLGFVERSVRANGFRPYAVFRQPPRLATSNPREVSLDPRG